MESSQFHHPIRAGALAANALAAIILLQPLLDVLSYFMNEYGSTVVTTTLRMILLVAVSLLGFALSRRKRAYILCFSAVAALWLLRALNCLRLGYQDPIGDAAQFFKLAQFPLWTLSFITLLGAREGLDLRAAGLLAANLGTVLLVIALSYAVGMPVYTYDIPSRGVQIGLLGWFAVPNSQSAIVAILTLGALLWAYQKGRVWLFCAVCVPSFGLLYFTGTRVPYYSGILIALGLSLLVLLAGGRMRLCCVPLLLAAVLMVGFKGSSIMEYRQTLTQDSNSIYQAPADEIMGEDKDYVYTGGEVPPDILKKITRVYEEVYGGESFAGDPLLGDLLERFGTERVMESYNYTTKASVLYNVRTKKLKVTSMLWEDGDLATRLLGFEYASAILNDNCYDPENDFPGLLFFYGYLGCGLYVAFAGYFLLSAAWRCVKNIRRLPEVLTVPLGTWAMILALGLGAAQFSGHVLRRPSVTVYLSLAAAQLYLLTHDASGLHARYERRAGLTIKQSPMVKGGGKIAKTENSAH